MRCACGGNSCNVFAATFRACKCSNSGRRFEFCAVFEMCTTLYLLACDIVVLFNVEGNACARLRGGCFPWFARSKRIIGEIRCDVCDVQAHLRCSCVCCFVAVGVMLAFVHGVRFVPD